jgi:hypothetical protein
VDVRAAKATDRLYDQYFGIGPNDDKLGKADFRNIAIANGTFTLDTWLSASLYHVKRGEIQELNSITVGRCPNQIGAPHWLPMKFTLALADRRSPEGRITQLGSHGESRGGGRSSEIVNHRRL